MTYQDAVVCRVAVIALVIHIHAVAIVLVHIISVPLVMTGAKVHMS